MSTAPVDLTKMSAAEIKAFIENQTQPEQDPQEQPRDEKGRFVSPEPEPEGEPQEVVPEPEGEPVPEPVVVEREIDLEDGSGVQVFRGVGATEAEAYAALADELAKAQANATKKIRELSQKPAEPVPAPIAEDPLMLSQEFLDNPAATFDKLYKQRREAEKAEERRQAEAAAAAQRAEEAQTDQFLAANPDYHRCPENGDRISKYIKMMGLTRDRAGLQAAYDQLKADGLLVGPSAPAAPRGRSSGLSTRGSVAPPPPAPTGKDPRKMTLEELREAAGGYQYKNF